MFLKCSGLNHDFVSVKESQSEVQSSFPANSHMNKNSNFKMQFLVILWFTLWCSYILHYQTVLKPRSPNHESLSHPLSSLTKWTHLCQHEMFRWHSIRSKKVCIGRSKYGTWISEARVHVSFETTVTYDFHLTYFTLNIVKKVT